MDMLLSYSPADSKLARRLSEALRRRGVSVVLAHERPDSGRGQPVDLEDVVRSACDYVLLIDPREEHDPEERRTWQLVLEAVWDDPRKRLIPVLLRGAGLPRFVLSGAAGSDIGILRLEESEDLAPVADAVAEIAESRRPKVTMRGASSVSYGALSAGDDGDDDADYYSCARSERSQRFDELAQLAKALK